MKPTKLTPPPYLSESIVPDSYAGSARRRNRHADRLGSFPLLSDTGTQRGDARLDDQTWRMCLRWCQRLRQWYAKHFSEGSQRVTPGGWVTSGMRYTNVA